MIVASAGGFFRRNFREMFVTGLLRVTYDFVTKNSLPVCKTQANCKVVSGYPVCKLLSPFASSYFLCLVE